MELVRNHAGVYGEKEHSTYFEDADHVTLAEVAAKMEEANIVLAAADQARKMPADQSL